MQRPRHRPLSLLGSLHALWPWLSYDDDDDPTEIPHAGVHSRRLTHSTATKVTCCRGGRVGVGVLIDLPPHQKAFNCSTSALQTLD